jgi:hypothetical protein
VEAGDERRLSRTDVLCALVVAANVERTEMRGILEHYRTCRVADLVGDGEPDAENVVSLETRRPGPRRRA